MATRNTMHNLTTLIKRLEAATCRLEDIATSTELPKDGGALSPALSPALGEPPQASLVAPAGAGPKQATLPPLPESVVEFDALLESSVAQYVKLSRQLGGLLVQQAAEVLKGFHEQRTFLVITTRAAKPDQAVLQSLLKPTNDALMAVAALKESHRSDPLYTHLSAVADGIMMLAWVTVESRPHVHVEECLGSAQFFGNRVLKEHKDKHDTPAATTRHWPANGCGRDVKHVEWIQSFYQLFRDLAVYIRQYFPSGVVWNARGEPAAKFAGALSVSGFGSSGAPMPPPPPPPPPPPLDTTTRSDSGGFGAVFSELNKGAAITQGLRKVDKSETRHAMTPDRDTANRARCAAAPGKKPKPESMRAKKPARKELQGNKWTIENYDKEPQVVEIEASLTQSVLISRCNDATVIIKGKANQVTVENSSRLSLVVDTLVSTVDVVKAQNLALQVLGNVPAVLLDQVDGAQIYWSKASAGAKLFTSKSDGINLNVICGPDDDYKEVPLPSQICSYYDESKGELVSDIVAHAR